jgi:thiol:disulfide interchange protein
MLYRKLYGWAVVAFVLSAIPFTSLISVLAFAMTGNYIYFKHAKKKISELRRSRPSSELTAALASVGGVNQWVVTLSIVTIIVGSIGSGLLIGYSATRETKIGKISFVKDYNRGLDQAYETGKPVMLIFSAEWCGACKTMIREVFSDDEVAETSEQLINIYIDVDKVDRKLINDYQVKYVPSIFFLDYSGETIIRVAEKRATRDFINNMTYMYQMHSYSEQE